MGRLLSELKRRQMFRVAAAYAVVAWLILQVVNNVAPALRLPEWAATLVVVLLVVGFPVALLFCWIQHLAPADSAVAPGKTAKLDWLLISALILVIALISYQQLAPSPGAGTVQQGSVAPTSPTAQGQGIAIAVLPFANLSGDSAQEFFSDGMTEEITMALAKVPDLRVVGRTSAFQFKGQNSDLRAIGQALGAGYLIAGSVRKEGDRVRIAAQLIQAENGLNVWTESYDRQLTGVFATQEDIAQAIAGALRVPLGLRQGENLVNNRTSNVDSYEDYIRGRALLRGRAVEEAIMVLEQAVARDPAYAPAWAMLSQAYRVILFFDPATRTAPVEEARRFVQSNLDKAEMAARKAIELDPRHAGGYAALAQVQAPRGRWAEADDLFQQALKLDSNDPEALFRYGVVLAYVGRIKDSVRVMERLRTLEPFVPIYNANVAYIMKLNGQSEAGIALLESVPTDTPGRYYRAVQLAEAYAEAGRFAEAGDLLMAVRGAPQVSTESLEAAARLIRSPLPAGSPASLPVLQGEMNFVYAYVGAQERAMESPERALRIGELSADNGMFWTRQFASIRKTERFKAFARNAGLVDYWRARGWPDLCRPVAADDFECD
jgi:TolB-like protein/Tfp pilus assembly protein PilF